MSIFFAYRIRQKSPKLCSCSRVSGRCTVIAFVLFGHCCQRPAHCIAMSRVSGAASVVSAPADSAAGSGSSAPSVVIPLPASGKTPAASAFSSGCWFECGAVSELTNIGNAHSVKLACGQCNSSRRCVDAQARADPELKKVLANLKRDQQSTYKEFVRKCRLDSVNGASAEPGRGFWSQPGFYGERAKAAFKALVSYKQVIEDTKQVSLNETIMYPDQAEFVTYHQTWKGMTAEEAKAKWKEDSENPDIERMGSGKDLRIAVRGIPTAVASHVRGQKRSIEASATIENAGHLDIANKRLNSIAGSSSFLETTSAGQHLYGQMQLTGADPGQRGPLVTADDLRSTALAIEETAAPQVVAPSAKPVIDIKKDSGEARISVPNSFLWITYGLNIDHTWITHVPHIDQT